MFRGKVNRAIVPALLAGTLAAAGLTLAACGSDSGEPVQTAATGSPTSAGDLVDPAAAKAISKPREPDRCRNDRSNEEICSDYSNYLLSYRPVGNDADYGTRGPYLVGSGSTDSSINFENVTTGAGDDGQNRGWNKDVKKGFGDLLEVDFSDTGDIGNSGSVTIASTAGDVDFGTSHFWLRNEDGEDDDDAEGGRVDNDNDWAFCEKQRGGGGGPLMISCGAPDNPTKGTMVCQDDGDDEECGFSFYLQDYPVRVGVFNKLEGSEFVATSVSEDQPSEKGGYDIAVSDQASTLKGKAKIGPGEDGLWLAAFRAVGGGQIKVAGVLKATDDAKKSEAWAGQNVFLTATFVKKGEKEVQPVCTIENKSAGTQASCKVSLTNGSVSRPGTVTFTIQS